MLREAYMKKKITIEQLTELVTLQQEQIKRILEILEAHTQLELDNLNKVNEDIKNLYI